MYIRPISLSMTALMLAVALTGCAGTSSLSTTKAGCDLPERDLTVAWEARAYWCIPKGYQPRIEKRVYPYQELERPASALSTPIEAISTPTAIPTHSAPVALPATPLFIYQPSTDGSVDNVDKELSRNDASTQAPAQAASSKNQLNSLITFPKKNNDRDFIKEELVALLPQLKTIHDRIFLAGCRSADEQDALALGRALTLRAALKEHGINAPTKISNATCHTAQTVRITAQLIEVNRS